MKTHSPGWCTKEQRLGLAEIRKAADRLQPTKSLVATSVITRLLRNRKRSCRYDRRGVRRLRGPDIVRVPESPRAAAPAAARGEADRRQRRAELAQTVRSRSS